VFQSQLRLAAAELHSVARTDLADLLLTPDCGDRCSTRAGRAARPASMMAAMSGFGWFLLLVAGAAGAYVLHSVFRLDGCTPDVKRMIRVARVGEVVAGIGLVALVAPYADELGVLSALALMVPVIAAAVALRKGLLILQLGGSRAGRFGGALLLVAAAMAAFVVASILVLPPPPAPTRAEAASERFGVRVDRAGVTAAAVVPVPAAELASAPPDGAQPVTVEAYRVTGPIVELLVRTDIRCSVATTLVAAEDLESNRLRVAVLARPGLPDQPDITCAVAADDALVARTLVRLVRKADDTVLVTAPGDIPPRRVP